ncbi:hypothetical protein NP233_g12540 [Leucocoprinus birnbaumii]|uniref:Uncharacterized protein n=1 Tax=Leucocoprinus birnbaumii TaxID=56174 RepID=A0AAD5VFH8_9AGAR|nr:hypothetical protein NP233_g12540 [Leucocoprinus birnbaumii]
MLAEIRYTLHMALQYLPKDYVVDEVCFANLGRYVDPRVRIVPLTQSLDNHSRPASLTSLPRSCHSWPRIAYCHRRCCGQFGESLCSHQVFVFAAYYRSAYRRCQCVTLLVTLNSNTMKNAFDDNIAKQKKITLYLDGPAKIDFDMASRAKIRKWLKKVWQKMAEKTIREGRPGPICGVVAEIATIHAPMPSSVPAGEPFYGISHKRSRDGLDFDSKFDIGMKVRAFVQSGIMQALTFLLTNASSAACRAKYHCSAIKLCFHLPGVGVSQHAPATLHRKAGKSTRASPTCSSARSSWTDSDIRPRWKGASGTHVTPRSFTKPSFAR